MQTENWKKVKEILPEVLQLNVSEREKFLDDSGVSGEIRKEVESLLAFENESENFMSLTAGNFTKEFFAADEKFVNSLIKQKIGVYEIASELGQGGMGAVYLAERTDGKFKQRVAVKMLKREFNTEKIRRRFKNEREIQAALSHPNIATLLDAGTTDDGIPFLIMEYIEGVPIDKFCESDNLSLNERLKIFNRVCEAVAFAHSNLVVHRDLKPSNILVMKNGEPKLLDFGISKLLDAESEATNTITILGVMTPKYASPEQIQGKSVTTATDIYSLGVILFKVLTGTFPYNFEIKTNGETLKSICEQEPETPSRAYRIKNEQSPESQIPNLNLKGDLDNIILKSLRKEPNRRYQTVEQFSADIRRFIDGLPISARRSTVSYRAGKFLRRNKIFVIAGVLIFLSLMTGITVAVWQANAAREQARIAAEAQQKAEIEAAHSKAEEERAKKITEFMEQIIAYANPGAYAKGFKSNGEAKVIDVLGEVGDKIETKFPNQPDIQAELHHKFAEIYTMRLNSDYKIVSADEAQKAMYHARRAIELRKQFYGERDELVAKDMYYLWAAKTKYKAEDPQLLADAIQMMRETSPKNLNLPYMLMDYAGRLWSDDQSAATYESCYKNALPKPEVGRLELAENYQTEALALFRASVDENYSGIICCQCDLGMIQIKRGKFDEAQNNFQFCSQKKNFSSDEKSVKQIERYALKLEKGLKK